MCGLAGFVDFKREKDIDVLKQMTDSLAHRGPDSSGYDLIEGDACNIGLGHRRLSIIDLSPLGHQPMYSKNNAIAIVYNGEIYNYAAIREDLIAKGYSFISGSDTEVIINAYLAWGIDSVKKFIGMFAFALWDKEKAKFFLCADRAGVKPIYYYWKSGSFLFSSELKAFFKYPGFEKNIDTSSFTNFLQYSYVPAPYTIFHDTFKLQPGHCLELDTRSQKIEISRYWDVLDYYAKPKLEISEDEATEELERRLKTACDYRMVSDVPVGVFLSGGYDSSLVTAMLQTGRTEKIKTFTIGFPEKKYDEASHAKAVATHLKTDHHELYCTYDEAKSIIPQLPDYYDEPFGDSSAIPTMLLSRFARKSVTVALSADGGDEVFAGYQRHAALLSLSERVSGWSKGSKSMASFVLNNAPSFIINKLIKGKDTSAANLKKYVSFIDGSHSLSDMADYANQTLMPEFGLSYTNLRKPEERDFFQKKRIENLPGSLDRLLAFDYLSYLPGDILTKVDRATMSASLEGREPLLDQHIIEWVATIPDRYKYNNGTSKYLLRKIVHKYIPVELMHRPKMGFAIPLTDWFRTDLKYLFEDHLNKESLSKHGLISDSRMKDLLDKYFEGNDYVFPFLWNVLMFQLWYEKWMTNQNN